MKAEIRPFIQSLEQQASSLEFSDIIGFIDKHYDFRPTAFSNGGQRNESGENSGSCKVLSFAKINDLSQQQALLLFAQFYRDVVDTPQGKDHQNIRQFMKHGYDGLSFDGSALTLKS